jgi:hypothetical protein
MVYRITLSSNPKIVFIFLIILALPAAGVALIFVSPLFGVVIVAVACYIDYHLAKFLISTIRSRVETSDEGIFFDLGLKDSTRMTWDDITHAGVFTEQKKHPHIFIYCEEDDRLMIIPPEYSGFADLVEELRNKTSLDEIDLPESETIKDYLKEKIGKPAEETETEETDEADA